MPPQTATIRLRAERTRREELDTLSPTRREVALIYAAADALAGLVNEYRPGASLLPSMSNLRLVSSTVAIAVAQTAEQQGLARTPMTDPINDIYQRMWKPEYPRLEALPPRD